MIDGTYTVAAKTPLGKSNGTIAIATAETTCSADLTIAGKTKHLEGTLDGNHAVFKDVVKLPFPIGKTEFTIEGTIEGDKLQGVCRTKKFSFDIAGERVS